MEPESASPGGARRVADQGSADPVLRFFRTDDLTQNLGQRTARGGVSTLAVAVVSLAVTTLTTLWLTRALSPSDYGLFGMVLVVSGFASMFVDLGLSRAVVQREEITQAQVSTLFWINLGIATVLAIVVALATPLVVAFYEEPRLATINVAMAGLFVVGALALQHRALLERRMEFGRLNAISLASLVGGAIAAVVVAELGGGYWALVVMPAVAQGITVVGMFVACPWRPSLPRRRVGARSMLAFGGHVTGFQVMNYFHRNADNAMLGYAWGASALGLYARAYSLMMLPASKLNGPLTQVVVPALSRVREQPERYRRLFARVLGLSSLALVPGMMLAIVLADPGIPLLFGEPWAEMVPIFYALSPAALMGATSAATGWLYLSYGHVERRTPWVAFTSLASVGAMLAGLPFGAIGVAVAVSAFQVLIRLPSVWWAAAGTPVRLSDYVAAVRFPFVASSIAAGAAWGLLSMLSLDPLPHLGVASIAFALAFGVQLVLLPAGRRNLALVREALALLRARTTVG